MTTHNLRADGKFHQFAVVGGGLSGLVLARIMQCNGHDAVVFEREPSRDFRTQGGVLDLHPESGQWALTQAGLDAEFRAMAYPEGQDMRILDKQGKVLWEETSPPDLMARPEVDRRALRNVLIDSLQPHTMMWDHQLVSLEPAAVQGHYTLCFANGTTVTAGVVIGADGARSCVRPLLTEALPSYSGVNFIEVGISDVEAKHPELAKTVGRGQLFALGENKGLIAMRNSNGRHIGIYVAFRMPEKGFDDLGIAFDDPTATRTAIVAQFEGWAPEIIALIKSCDDNFVPRPINAMPVGISWSSQPTITLLGDAAHLMSPFAGEGANLAMQDGADLALELIKTDDPAIAIAVYEAKMFERAETAARESAKNLDLCISWDGSAVLAKLMQSYHQPN